VNLTVLALVLVASLLGSLGALALLSQVETWRDRNAMRQRIASAVRAASRAD
jgi:hypothetical protein